MKAHLALQLLAFSLTLFGFFLPTSSILAQNYLARDHFQKGEIELHVGDFAKAVDYYSKAISLHRNYSHAYFARGKAYLLLEEPTKAQADFEKVVKMDAQPARGHFYLGILAYEHLSFEEAIQHFDTALVVNPDYALAYNYRAESYRELGLITPAVENYSQAIQREPREAILYFGRGKCYMELEKYHLAYQDFSKAVELEPRKIAYHQYLTESSFLNEDYALTIEHIQQLDQMNPEGLDAHYYYLQVFCHQQLENHEGAIHAIHQVIDLEPNDPKLYAERAGHYFQINQFQKAIQDYVQAILLDADNVDYYDRCSRIYMALQDHENAIKYLSSALITDPHQPEIWYLRGQCHLHLENKRQAKEDFIQAAERGFPAERMDKQAYKYARKIYKKKNK